MTPPGRWAYATRLQLQHKPKRSTSWPNYYAGADRDNGDNGTYLLGHDLTIIERFYKRGPDEINPAKTAAIAEIITASAPAFN